MLAEILEVLGDALVAVGDARRGPRHVHSRIRLTNGEIKGLSSREDVVGEVAIDHRTIAINDVALTGVAIAPQPLRMTYLDDIQQRAQVVRIEFDGGAAEWTIPESTNLRKLQKRIGASF